MGARRVPGEQGGWFGGLWGPGRLGWCRVRGSRAAGVGSGSGVPGSSVRVGFGGSGQVRLGSGIPHSPRPAARRRSTGPCRRARRLRCSAPCGCSRCSTPQRGPRPSPRRDSRDSSDSDSSSDSRPSSSAAAAMARGVGGADRRALILGNPTTTPHAAPPPKSCPSQVAHTHPTTTTRHRQHKSGPWAQPHKERPLKPHPSRLGPHTGGLKPRLTSSPAPHRPLCLCKGEPCAPALEAAPHPL